LTVFWFLLYAQKERPGGEPYRLCTLQNQCRDAEGDYNLALNKYLLLTFHHRKVAYALPTSCTHPAGRPLFTPQGNKIPQKQ